MKKKILLILSLLVVTGLAWLTYRLISNRGTSVRSELINFAIDDVSKIDKIVISDESENSFSLVKNGNKWSDINGNCVNNPAVDVMLDAFKNIEFKGYLSDGEADFQTERMSVKHLKVEIFEQGSWIKTWYIGNSTPDHYGQIMLVDSKEYGKSDLPVIMQIKGVKGIIEPRFYVDPRKWACTEIFALENSEIKKVDVKFIQEPTRSFSVENLGNSFRVFQNNKILPNVDNSRIFLYLNNYKKVHYNIANYLLDKKQIDSLKRTSPFCVLTVSENKGRVTRLPMYRFKNGRESANGFGQTVDYNGEVFWCFLPSGELVKCQYYVFNPLILGHIYFPLDMSKVNTMPNQ